MPIGKVWIYRLLFVSNFVFVQLRISPPRIKQAASNLLGGSSAFWAQNVPFWGTLLSRSSPKSQNRLHAVGNSYVGRA